MKKKVLAIVLVAVLALVAIGGATVAYFTDTTTATNVITSGKVDIKLDEGEVEYSSSIYEWVPTGERTEEGVTYENVYPGAILPKDPTVYNEGNMDAYVRIKVAFPVVTDNAQADFAAIGSLFAIGAEDGYTFGNLETYNLEALFEGFDATLWDVEQTAYNMPFFGTPDTMLELTFTLKDKLAAGEQVTLFTAVNVSADIEDSINVEMDITAEAVQAASFADAAAAFAATFDADLEVPEDTMSDAE